MKLYAEKVCTKNYVDVINEFKIKYICVFQRALIISVMAFLLILTSCTKEDDDTITPPEETSIYFPPLNADVRESTTPTQLGWNTAELANLLNFLRFAL